jgi:hypothetical protein
MRILVVPFLVVSCAWAHSDERSLVDLAHHVAVNDMGQDKWDAYVKAAKEKYADASSSWSSLSQKAFLDSRTLTLACGLKGAKVEDLKKLVYWIALYKELDEPAPRHLDLPEEKLAKLRELVSDFDWERLRELIAVEKKPRELADAPEASK